MEFVHRAHKTRLSCSSVPPSPLSKTSPEKAPKEPHLRDPHSNRAPLYHHLSPTEPTI